MATRAAEQNIPLLEYNRELQRWEASYGEVYIWMADSIFQKYINVYLREHNVNQPTLQQYEMAVQHCRRLAYWTRARYDAAVHFKRKVGK